MKTENLVFVTGPIGCGKTTNAKELCKHFECSHWLEGIEEVFRYTEFPTKILVLTCAPAEGLKAQFPGATVVDFYKACYDAKLTAMPAENYSIPPEMLIRMMKGAWSAGHYTSKYSPNTGFLAEKESKEIIGNFLGKK